MTIEAGLRERIENEMLSKGEVTGRKMFGTTTFLVRGRMFAFWTGDGLVVKLPDRERQELLDRQAGTLFQGPQGRFGEWVRVSLSSEEDAERCAAAARESYGYVRGNVAKQAARKKSRR